MPPVILNDSIEQCHRRRPRPPPAYFPTDFFNCLFLFGNLLVPMDSLWRNNLASDKIHYEPCCAVPIKLKNISSLDTAVD